MKQKRLTALLAGTTMVATILLGQSMASAVADRVEQEVKMDRGTNNGTSGYWVTVTERVYRWDSMYAQRISKLFPGGHGLTAYELQQLYALLDSLGGVDDAKLKAAVQAVQAWKDTAHGYRYDGWGKGLYSSRSQMVSTAANNLASRLTAALGKTVSASGPVANMASQLASDRAWYYDPLVFDLNADGKINVTGVSTAKIRAPQNEKFVRQGSVLFDILGNGKPARIEWVTNGDGILIDNRNNAARKLVEQGKPLSIVNLFGDSEGNAGGFMKLARTIDSESRIASSGDDVKPDGLGIIKGKELDDLLMWVDNGDGKAELKELHTMASLGITEIRLPHRHIHNADGELIEEATFIRNGKPYKIQEVWFMGEPADAR